MIIDKFQFCSTPGWDKKSDKWQLVEVILQQRAHKEKAKKCTKQTIGKCGFVNFVIPSRPLW